MAVQCCEDGDCIDVGNWNGGDRWDRTVSVLAGCSRFGGVSGSGSMSRCQQKTLERSEAGGLGACPHEKKEGG
jgi:hypothetical protein